MKTTTITALAIVLFSCNSQKEIKTDYEVNKNEVFEVTMKSNPTTGYTWKWIKDKTPQIVDSLSATYVQDKAAADMVGVGGNVIWKFKGKEAGIDTLTFENSRSWEKNAAVETKKVVVKVK